MLGCMPVIGNVRQQRQAVADGFDVAKYAARHSDKDEQEDCLKADPTGMPKLHSRLDAATLASVHTAALERSAPTFPTVCLV